MSGRGFALVVAADEQRGIGRDGTLPWRLPGDMAFFKRVTSEATPGKQNAVLMGRKTYASIPAKFRPLPGRLNLVLSRDPAYVPEGAERVPSLEEAVETAGKNPQIEQLFVIGGGDVYAQALAHAACERVYLTRVHGTFDCDTFLAPFERQFRLIESNGPHRDGDVSYTFETYQRT
jgi:dihydrofolate reductase